MQTLELRLTHVYADTWRNEDEWKDIGEYEIVSTQKWREITDDDDFDATEPLKHIYEVVVVPNGAGRLDDIDQALIDAFSHSGCHHEYDCCGCRSFSAQKPEYLYKHEDGWHYRVTVNSYRNY